MRTKAGVLWAGVACAGAAVAVCTVLAWQTLFRSGATSDGAVRLLRSYTGQISRCAQSGMARSVCIDSATEACMADEWWQGDLDKASTACARLPLRPNR